MNHDYYFIFKCVTPEHRKKYRVNEKIPFWSPFLCVCSKKFVRKTINSLSFNIYFFTGFRNILIILILVHESWSGMILNVIQKRKRKIFFYNIVTFRSYIGLVMDLALPEIGFFRYSEKCIVRHVAHSFSLFFLHEFW